MLRMDNRIRLTPADRRKLVQLTGSVPPDLRTVEAYNRWIEEQAAQFDGRFMEGRLLRALVEHQKLAQTG